MTSRDMSKYAAMRPYFSVVAESLDGLVDGIDFFDMHAEDVVVEYIITVPGYPRRVVGRDALAELYSDYGDSIVQSGSSDVHRYYDPEQSVVVLEYTMHGTVVRSGEPYVNRFVSVITVKDRRRGLCQPNNAGCRRGRRTRCRGVLRLSRARTGHRRLPAKANRAPRTIYLGPDYLRSCGSRHSRLFLSRRFGDRFAKLCSRESPNVLLVDESALDLGADAKLIDQD
jgi:ketosteroid isomerase-like protein